jgi:uncharacterized protein YndB with AHSA1/START domain
VSRQIEANGFVPVPREAVFDFLAELANHWRVADRFVEVLELDGSTGGRVRLRGPLGTRRTARTTVVAAESPHHIAGVAELGAHTRARVQWTLIPAHRGTRVMLSACVERAGPLDRLLLRLGGRAWLTRRFTGTLANLARHFAVDRGARRVHAMPIPAAR